LLNVVPKTIAKSSPSAELEAMAATLVVTAPQPMTPPQLQLLLRMLLLPPRLQLLQRMLLLPPLLRPPLLLQLLLPLEATPTPVTEEDAEAVAVADS